MKSKTRKTSHTAILLVLISSVFTAIGQVFLKTGVDTITTLVSAFNFFLIIGFILYGAALVLLLKAYKHGELSVLYPVIALSYVWVVLLSNLLLGESLNLWKIFGVAVIFVGVTLIGIGRD